MPDGKAAATALGEERAILAAAADAADQRAWRVAAEIYGTLKAGALIAAVDAVLALHVPASEPDSAFCAECGTGYPCATRKAISRALLEEDGS